MGIKLERALLWVVRIGLWIVPFIPLYVSSRLFFPYITGKAFIFRTVVEVVFAAWVALALASREYRPRKSPLVIAVTLFIAAIALATIFGANPYRSFWSNFERMEGLVTHLHLFAYFLVLTHAFRPKDWQVFWNLFLVSGFFQNGYALFQKLGFLESRQGGFRVDGTIGNPTYVAAYLVFVVAIATFLFLQTKHRWARIWYGAVGIFSLITIYFTATRGVILAFLVGLFIAGVVYLWKARSTTTHAKLAKRIVLGLLILLVLSGVAVKALRGNEIIKQSEILSRLASISLKDGSSRFLIWNMGWQGFKERPLLGWGPENYNIIFAKHYSPKLYTQEPWFDRSHNFIFDWLISAGIIGLLSYLGMCVTAIYSLWKFTHSASDQRTAFLFSLLFFVYLFQNMFVFDQLATYIGLFAVFAFLASGLWRGEDMGERVAPRGAAQLFALSQGKTALAAGCAIILMGAWYFTVYQSLAANLNLIRGMSYRRSEEVGQAFDALERALAYRSSGDQEIREQLAQFTIGVVGSGEVEDTLKERIFTRAMAELNEGILETPRDPRTYLFAGAVSRAGGQFDLAVTHFERALSLSPKKQQIAFELGDTYLREGKFEQAVEVLEVAYALEPRFDEARYNLVAAYILNDRQDKADEILLAAHGRTDVPVLLLAQVYEFKGDTPRLLKIWEAFVAGDPENIDYRKKVAAGYLELGKPSEAVRVLEEAIAAIPSFKEEGESYIAEIQKQGL